MELITGKGFFRTKAIRATSKQSILSSLNASKLSLLLQSEHLEETGSGWVSNIAADLT